MGLVRSVGKVFFPLDEELRLLGSDVTPQVQEGLVRLAAWVPFGPAAELLESLLGVHVSKASARRYTLEAGEAGIQEWEEQTDIIQQKMTEPTGEASQQVLSADGAMVPLVGGEWAEVKTLVIGEASQDKEGEPHVAKLSYCSRLTDVPGFERASLREIHRRGIERAQHVAAVTDGAEWLQGFIDYHRADAVRILDFPHAAEYVHAIGEAARATGHHFADAWLKGVLHRLKHEGPQRVLRHLEALCTHCPDPEVRKKLQYLNTRQASMEYPAFRSAGWPIGSGMVESANKLVVEARLKGAGMHWKRENVNAMLLLRNAVCNDRWDEAWEERMKQSQQRRRLRRVTRTHARLHQALCRLLAQTFPLLLLKKDQPPPVPSEVLPVPPKPTGRTEAQKRWGRRSVTVRGACIKAEFAKH
jgi:hypothetical protein